MADWDLRRRARWVINWHCVAVITFSGSIIACTRAPKHVAPVVVYDSAGIRIVSNTYPVWRVRLPWLLGSPRIVAGPNGSGRDLLGEGVVNAYRLSSSAIMVANGPTCSLRILSSDGQRVLHTTGGCGLGGGRFSEITEFGRTVDDSFFVLDAPARQISIIAPDGTVKRRVTLQDRQLRHPWVVGYLGKNSFAIGNTTLPAVNARTRLAMDTTALVTIAPSGAVSGLIASCPNEVFDTKGRWANDGSIDNRATPLIFTGRCVAVARPGLIVVGNSRRFAVDMYAGQSKLLQCVVERAYQPREVRQTDIDHFLQETRDRLALRPEAEYRREMLIAQQTPAEFYFPSFSHLFLDSGGDLWIQEYSVASDSIARWRVFRPDGRELGVISFPASFRLTDAGMSYVLGVVNDAPFGGESLVMYGLARRMENYDNHHSMRKG